MKKNLLLLILIVITTRVESQIVNICPENVGFFNPLPTNVNSPYHTPAFLFDTIYDAWGNQWKYDEIEIHTDASEYRSAPSVTCQAGYFNVYFATGSGMELQFNPVHQQRRAVICEVLQNISGMVN